MLTRGLIKAHGDATALRTKLLGAMPEAPQRLMHEAGNPSGSLYLYEQIGAEFFGMGGMTAKDMVDALEAAKKAGCKDLAVRILSEGGDAWEGVAMYEALKRCGMKTTAYNDGLCASAATLVALGCNKVVAAATSTWMSHRAYAMAAGNSEDMMKMAAVLNKVDQSIAEVYAQKSGKSAERCLAMMGAETWMTARECKAFGFADEIASGKQPDEDLQDSAMLRVMATTELRISSTEARERLSASVERLKAVSGASPDGKKRDGQPAA